MVSRKFTLFGGSVQFHIDELLDTENPVIDTVLDQAYTVALRLQRIFNIYDEKSELSALNRNRKIKPSNELKEVIAAALKLCNLTDGEYDITLGKQFLKRKRHEPISNTNCSYRDVKMTKENIILEGNEAMIDLGSIAKGYITDRIVEFLLSQGIASGYIDSRGDICVFGEPRNVAIKHPRSDALLMTINVKDKGVATSGDYNQYDEDYSKSHILNQKEIISATVVADSLMEADAYATIFMVCSKEVREQIISKEGFPAMTIDNNFYIQYYNGFKGLIINEN